MFRKILKLKRMLVAHDVCTIDSLGFALMIMASDGFMDSMVEIPDGARIKQL